MDGALEVRLCAASKNMQLARRPEPARLSSPSTAPPGLEQRASVFSLEGERHNRNLSPAHFLSFLCSPPASPSAPWPCPRLSPLTLPRNTLAHVCEIQNPLLMIVVSTGLVVQQRQAGTFQSNFTVSYTGAGPTGTEHSDLGEAFGVQQLAHYSSSGIILSPSRPRKFLFNS